MGNIHTSGPNEALIISGGCCGGENAKRTVVGGWGWAWWCVSGKFDLILSTWKNVNMNIDQIAKGQLISKCPFGVIISTKIPTKKFDNFCPRI